jgi:hypothetical protein
MKNLRAPALILASLSFPLPSRASPPDWLRIDLSGMPAEPSTGNDLPPSPPRYECQILERDVRASGARAIEIPPAPTGPIRPAATESTESRSGKPSTTEAASARASAENRPALATPPPLPPAIHHVVTQADGAGLVDDANALNDQEERRASQTTAALLQPLRNESWRQLEERLRRSEEENRKTAEELSRARDENEQTRRTITSLRDAADLARRAAEEAARNAARAPARGLASDDSGADAPNFPLRLPLSSGAPAEWASSSPASQSLLGAPPAQSALSADEATRRLALWAALNSAERQRLTQSGDLEFDEIRLPNGQVVRIPRASGGAAGLGGMSPDRALPCAAFLQNALPDELRRHQFTAFDFATVWQYRHTGQFPDSPVYSAAKRAELEALAPNFDAIDLYSGNARPIPGDLLIEQPGNQLTLVTDFSPESLQVSGRRYSLATRQPAAVSVSLRGMEAPNSNRRLQILRIRRSPNGNCELRAQPRAEP